jgi:hypothetical protein
MKYLPIFITVLICESLAAQEPAPVHLQDLETLTEQWIGLRGTLAEEERMWRQRKARWLEEIALLREEAAALRQEKETQTGFLDRFDLERGKLLEQAELLRAELNALDRILASRRRDVENLAAEVPEGLNASLPVALKTAQKPVEEFRMPNAQHLMAFLSGIESIQNRFHATREVLEINGERRQVEVLYAGLAQAWAVTPDRSVAGVGTPGPEGWIWDFSNTDPEQVHLALQVFQRQETATLTQLPLSLPEEDQ